MTDKPYNPDGASTDTGYKKLGEMKDTYGVDTYDCEIDVEKSDNDHIVKTAK